MASDTSVLFLPLPNPVHLCPQMFFVLRLARTIKRTRWMNLLPYHSKLHPKLRYTSLNPLPDREGLGLVNPIALAAPQAELAGFAKSTSARSGAAAATMPDRSSPISHNIKQSVDVALAEIAAMTGSKVGNAGGGSSRP
jgi:hypothetical protein